MIRTELNLPKYVIWNTVLVEKQNQEVNWKQTGRNEISLF